jgi:hypothetical protein
MVDFGSEQGLSDFETRGITSPALGQNKPFMDGHYLTDTH